MMQKRSYTLSRAGRVPVEIDGREYEVAAGDVVLLQRVVEWQEAAERVVDGPGTLGDQMPALLDLAAKGRDIVSCAMGAEAAEELLGPGGTCDLVRMVELMAIVVTVLSDAAASDELRADIEASVSTLDA